MKQISTLIASVSLSLVTVGAIAQSIAGAHLGNKSAPKIFVKPVHKGSYFQGKSAPAQHKISSVTYNGMLNYPAWDDAFFFPGAYQGSNENNGWGSDLINMHYVIGDTGRTADDKNYSLIHSYTVAFDSLYDWYSQTSLGGRGYTIQSIDTLWALVSYKNKSGHNDTVIFQGMGTIAGYPSGAILFADTIIIGSYTTDTLVGQYFGDSLDQLYYIGVLPGYTPTSNSFAVNLLYYGSKADTFEVAYGFPDFMCSPYEYASKSDVGIDLSGLYSVNTFTTGWVTVFGTVTQMPTNAGGYVFYGVACSDTGFWYEQDAAIFASITYSNTLTGTANVSSNGLSVNQNYPNPFNKTTQITYNLVKSSDVVFTVCDMTGRELTNNVYSSVAPGSHEINLSANSFAPGVYFYTLKVNGNQVTKKMVITE